MLFASVPWQLRIIAKESLGRFPFLGWHLRRTGHLLVDRRRPDRGGILRKWKALVGDGLSLIVFPEGTRSADGRVGTFKAGSFLLAVEAKLPIVPLSVDGTRFVMRKGRLMTCPGHARLRVHAPIETIGARRARRPRARRARARDRGGRRGRGGAGHRCGTGPLRCAASAALEFPVRDRGRSSRPRFPSLDTAG